MAFRDASLPQSKEATMLGSYPIEAAASFVISRIDRGHIQNVR
jgi:hypothetical protein